MRNLYTKLFLFVILFATINVSAQVDRSYLRQYDKKSLSATRDSLQSAWDLHRIALIKKAKDLMIPMYQQDRDGNTMELQWIDTTTNTPIYYTTYNVNAAKSTRAKWLNPGGGLGLSLQGQDMKVAVWDAGIARITHQEYQDSGSSRYSVGDTSTNLDGHAAHVTGTIMANGIDTLAKGMAQLSIVVGYKWDNDIAEAYTQAMDGLLISNHSYGYSPSSLPPNYFGGYDGTARAWDRLAYDAPYYLMVAAAGNSGSTTPNSTPMNPALPQYDKLSGFACSKNNMVVGNGQDANIDNATGSLISVTINGSSSQGPTDDYRIKPDITGNGTTLYSTLASSNTAYGNNSGTSMASPNVAGTLLLLQEHFYNTNGSYMKAASLKGLALHTADDAGITGPDANYGWGLLNAKSAAELITADNTSALIQELSLSNGQSYSRTLTSDGTNPLKVSISWTDPHSPVHLDLNDTSAVLINDLDIRVTKSSTTYYPWRLTGVNTNDKADNTKDPYELIQVDGATGDYNITITHKGSLTNGLQNFTLIASGINYTFNCNASIPSGVTLSDTGDHSLTISWNPIIDATYEVAYRVSTGGPWDTIATSANSTVITGLIPSTNYDIQVRSLCGTNASGWSPMNIYSTLEQQYCISEGTNTSDEFLNRVVLNTIDNTSGSSPSGYQDFTNIYTNLVKGNTYTLQMYPIWPGTQYPDGFSVFIDYDNNKIFDPITELVYSKAPSTDTVATGSITIPMSAVEDTVRIRISMKYNGIAEPCEIFDYGEVEDYSAIITNVPLNHNEVSIQGNRYSTNNIISWSATDYRKMVSYSLEYSNNAIDFTPIYTIDATNDKAYEYTYSHYTNDRGKHYYRVQATSTDFVVKYSKILQLDEIDKDNLSKVTLSPNPATNNLNINISDIPIDNPVSFRIFNIKGQSVYSSTIRENNAPINITTLSDGVYTVIFDDINLKPTTFIKKSQ